MKDQEWGTTVGQVIRRTRKAAGISQQALAGSIGYTKSSISEWETGAKTIGLEPLQRIAKFFDKDMSYFLGESPSESPHAVLDALRRPLMDILPVKAVPLIGRIHAGLPWHAEEAREGEHYVAQELPVDFALKVAGDSMIGANVRPGDLVLCRACSSGAEPHSGDMVVAILNGDEATLKFLIHERGQWILRAANPAYPDRVLVSADAPEIQAVVVRIDSAPALWSSSGRPSVDDEKTMDLSGISPDQRRLLRDMAEQLRQSTKKQGE